MAGLKWLYRLRLTPITRTILLQDDDVLMLMNDYATLLVTCYHELDHVLLADAFKYLNEQHDFLPKRQVPRPRELRYFIQPKQAKALNALLSLKYESLAKFSLCTGDLFETGVLDATEKISRIRREFQSVFGMFQ